MGSKSWNIQFFRRNDNVWKFLNPYKSDFSDIFPIEMAIRMAKNAVFFSTWKVTFVQDWAGRCDLIVEELHQAAPDLILLQEAQGMAWCLVNGGMEWVFKLEWSWICNELGDGVDTVSMIFMLNWFWGLVVGQLSHAHAHTHITYNITVSVVSVVNVM